MRGIKLLVKSLASTSLIFILGLALILSLFMWTACTKRVIYGPGGMGVSATDSMVFAMSVKRALDTTDFSAIKGKSVFVKVGAGSGEWVSETGEWVSETGEMETALIATAVRKKVLENGGSLVLKEEKADIVIVFMVEEGGLDIYRTNILFLVMTIMEKGVVKLTIYGVSTQTGKAVMTTSGEGTAEHSETYVLGIGPSVKVK